MKKILTFLSKKKEFLLYQAFTPLAPIDSQSGRLAELYSSGSLATYIARLFLFAITVGAILAVVRLMWAGYQYMGSADMWSTKSKAKETFGDVVFGILLLLAIYLILYQINPNILKIDILKNITQVPASASTPAAATTPAAAPAATVPVDESGTYGLPSGQDPCAASGKITDRYGGGGCI